MREEYALSDISTTVNSPLHKELIIQLKFEELFSQAISETNQSFRDDFSSSVFLSANLVFVSVARESIPAKSVFPFGYFSIKVE